MLVAPATDYLPSYVDALQRGYSPSSNHPERRLEELSAIEADPQAFLHALNDPHANTTPLRMRDGSTVPRLPGFRRWMWDGEFAGSISLRYEPGTPKLPPWCYGHIGYSVVPWKRRRGYATTALALILPEARKVGLPYVQITTTPDNVASQRVILSNGGIFVERFQQLEAHDFADGLRYHVML